MINVKISRKDMKATVYQGNKPVKEEDLTPETFKEYMNDFCESQEMLDGLRKATKLFKPSGYIFKNVKG